MKTLGPSQFVLSSLCLQTKPLRSSTRVWLRASSSPSPSITVTLTSHTPISELPATKMCRYRAWEDDFPESEEVHQQNFEERRYGTTAILDQLEECMNEMRAIIESLKEINARLKKINYYLLAFLLLLVGILVSHMCGRSPQVSKMKNSLV